MKMLSEEIFEETKQNMTKAQIDTLKRTYADNLRIIFELCSQIAKAFISNPSSVAPSLIKVCVKAFHSFLHWIPAQYIFMTDFLDGIMVPLVTDQRLTANVLECITDSFAIGLDSFSAEEKVPIRNKCYQTLSPLVVRLMTIFPLNRSFRDERRDKLKSHNQLTLFDNISKQIAQMIAAYFKNNFGWLFSSALELYQAQNQTYMEICNVIDTCIKYMTNLTDVENDILYKICIEFWLHFTTEKIEIESRCLGLTLEKVKNKLSAAGGLNLQNTEYDVRDLFRKFFDMETFNNVFKIMVRRMPRPQEVLIEINENGLPQRVTVDGTENANLFKIAQKCLANLSVFSWENMSMILHNMINGQTTNFSPDLLSALSWTVGALNGHLKNEDEKVCLTLILKNLLALNDMQKAQANKVIVVTNILYICGQYSRQLKTNWGLLSVLIGKLLDFMEFDFPGLSEMACTSFLKVCQTCNESLIVNHAKAQTETDPIRRQLDTLVWDIFAGISAKINKLTLANKLLYYEAIGVILSAIKQNDVLLAAIQVALKDMILSWKSFIGSVNTNPDLLKKDDTLMNISFFINVNEKLNSCIQQRFIVVFGKFGVISRDHLR